MIWLIVLILVVLCAFCIYFSFKKYNICGFLFDQNLLYSNLSKKKLAYKKLQKSDCEYLASEIYHYYNNIFAAAEINKNKNFLCTLAKFIDFKINNCKHTFRAKNKYTLIEEVSISLASDLVVNNQINIFQNFNKDKLKYKLKQKEIKIFKLLLAKNLIYAIYHIKHQLDKINKIILSSKNAKTIKFYKNSIYTRANIYGICLLNANRKKIIEKADLQITYEIARLFKHLYKLQTTSKICTSYLIALFN